ncbi:toxin-antitoxin system toxin subunit [Leptospira wolffii]|uniref:Toxin-antitoxin system toxin subunit n=1 Tax=Leptospira wolffii TaxID=409998 RepID=A0A2M9Z9C7_9LEPT|nr:nucleotidyltransferase family protein [Leptospira wolffii]PJZ65025.1 toxin-antitoxin system toxin subunit [Leptospira wolffii]
MFVKTQDELIRNLREIKDELADKYGLESIGIFGSFSKGTIREDSDVDLLVEFKEAKYDYLAGLKIFLENRLGRSVDLVRKRPNLNKAFLERIRKELIHV